jgi:acyl-[acyl-carrier-protein]-phospholipid O-acyltransferase/long-chain-fatty-acid--[acyl-carrier-protein] ligase
LGGVGSKPGTDGNTEGLGGLKWLNLCQFGGALNDNFLKLAIIYAMCVWWQGKEEKEILGLVGIAFAVPFLLFLGIGGNLADRLRKSKVAQWTKFLEILVAGVAVMAFYTQSIWGLFLTAFLMSTQSAIFSPVKYGIIPELAGQSGIARGNGYIQASTYLAIIGGTLLAPMISGLSSQNYILMGFVSLSVALVGWVFSLGIPRTPKGGGTRIASPLVLPDLYKTLKYIHSDGFLALAVWGSAYFSFVAGFAQLNLLSYGTEHLLLDTREESTSLFLFIALGIGFGSLVAGAFSRKSIEFGIVPIGAFLLSTCAMGLGFLAEGAYYSAAFVCFAMGFGAGLFIVPIESFIQYRSAPERRGEVVAAAGWLSWAGILVASGLVYLLPKMGMTAGGGFLFIGAMVAGLFGFAMYMLPDFLVRFFVMVLTRCYYRLNVGGQDNVPSQGGALIAANHASLMDAACLLAVQPRRIRFIMEREYIESSNGIMRCIFGLMGAIPVSKKGSPKDIIRALQEARKALCDGWLVGIFPEGTLTRTGHLLDFRRGYQKITKGLDASIVPAYIDGTYGTAASYTSPHPKPLSIKDFRRTIGVVFGEQQPPTIEPKDLREKVRELADQASTLRSMDEGSLGHQLVRSCRGNWNHIATADSSGKRLTFGQLLTACVAVGAKLQEVVGQKEKIVGIMLPPSVGGLVANGALTMLRKTTTNLNYTSSQESLESAIQIAEIETIITSRKFLDKIGMILPVSKVVFIEDMLSQVSLIQKAGAFFMARFLPETMLVSSEGWDPDEMVTVLFSSGSTALPKGVMLSHRNISSNIDAFSSVARVQKGDAVLGVLPFFHSMGYTTTIWFPLLKGLKSCYHYHPLECDHIEKLCASEGVTIVIGTPTFMLAWARKIDPAALDKLRWACAGAEKMRPKLADLFHRRFGIRPMEGYGTTECSPVVSVNVPDVDLDGVFQRGCKEGTAGKALPNIVCKIVDRDTGEELPSGQEGLLLVRGPSVMLGYLRNVEKTSEVLTEGWYSTGDIACIDQEGFIRITDRLSRFSKIGGEMVSHTAVEEFIKNIAGKLLPSGALGLAVTSVSDEKKGEKLVVLYEKETLDTAQVQKMVFESDMPNLWKPAPNCWVAVDKIPVLGTGKLDLRKLKTTATENIVQS